MQANELFTQPNTILLDGGMGTMLQAAGLKLGARPEELNITDPQLIESIHSRYAAAGSRIINANTFGASAHKLAGSEYTLEEIIAAGIANCKRACAPYGALAALDVGPLGELLEPNGTLAFEDAVAEYGRIVRAGVAAGADLVFFETFTDLYELKAALLAAKENCDLPILASMSFEAGGRTFTGCTVESFAVTARGLGANAVGINCSLGPKEIFPMAKRLAEALPGDFPVFVKPNAGLPRADGSGYDITPQLFAMEMKPYRDLKLFAAGGCCGTTPDFIKLLNGVFADCKPGRPAHAMPSVLCSPMDFVTVDGITVVGERINPTGKKRFQQALREGDMNYILEQAVSQSEAGAQVLDVNVGAPGVDEPAVMEQVVKALQSVVSLPLQLDSSHADALERGLRVYNGKPIVNSVNGETEVLERVLPLCKKYGAAVVGLAIDERGIQPSADARFEIAKRVVDAALAHGIPREDIYIDCLTLTASAQQQDVLATVEALARCKKELGVRTILGVSNISFGLPCRPYLNTTFLTMAMYAGLDLAIMNPSSEEMMAAVYSYNVLTNRDKQSMAYIARYADKVPASAALKQAWTAQASQTSNTPAEADAAHSGPFAALMQAVEKGLKGEAAARTHTLLEENEPLTLVDEALIPALDVVGEKYEKGKLFLPQLLQAASAAQAAASSAFFPCSGKPPACAARPVKATSYFVVARLPHVPTVTSPSSALPVGATCEASSASASSSQPFSTMACAPRTPSSAGWKISFTVPCSTSRCAIKMRATPKPMAACPSWPHACIMPGFTLAKPSRVGRCASCGHSVIGSASMSNRIATVGLSPHRRIAITPVYPARTSAVSSSSGAPCASACSACAAKTCASGRPSRAPSLQTARPV